MPAVRILVVEDDRGIRDLINEVLKGFDLEFATCQAEAYECLKIPWFDLVLLDLRLPQKTGDMKSSIQVGIDILQTIRKRRILRRDSDMSMPVLVMTAYGSEELSASVLIDSGANDYIPKPFGGAENLKRKIDRALAGEGALVPASNVVRKSIRLAFSASKPEVRVETLSYHGAHYELLSVLRDLYIKNLNELRAPENFEGIRGEVLADRLKISGEAVRRRVTKFRRQVSGDFQDQLRRAIGDNDIIENVRDWRGYRLNPSVVRIVAWDQVSDNSK